MATIWTIAIDWERNDNFTGAYDDVTSRVISATWFLGNRQPYQEMADDSMLRLKLDNSDKRYSPEECLKPDLRLPATLPARAYLVQRWDQRSPPSLGGLD
jgi:hypothetical protein